MRHRCIRGLWSLVIGLAKNNELPRGSSLVDSGSLSLFEHNWILAVHGPKPNKPNWSSSQRDQKYEVRDSRLSPLFCHRQLHHCQVDQPDHHEIIDSTINQIFPLATLALSKYIKHCQNSVPFLSWWIPLRSTRNITTLTHQLHQRPRLRIFRRF